MKYYVAYIPFIPELGSVSPIVCSENSNWTKEEDVLSTLNNMRDHDGIPHRKSLPNGVKFYPEGTTEIAIKAQMRIDQMNKNLPWRKNSH